LKAENRVFGKKRMNGGFQSKIKDIRVHRVEVPLYKAWQISLYSQANRGHILVEVEAEDGTVGIGESSPSAAFMGEESRPMVAVIEEILAPQLIGKSPFDLEAIHHFMDKAIPGNSSAKAALDIAIHDLLGKILRVPVYNLLGGRFRSQADLTWVVSIQDEEGALEEIQKFRGLGIRTFKVKIGLDPDRDIGLVSRIREHFGTGIQIRVDANQGYGVDQAIKVLRKMEAYELEAIEQPVPAYDLEGMQRIAAALDTPIIADESVFGVQDALKVIELRAADIINIKIGKAGGLYPAKKIAAVAEAANVPCTVGSNLELGVGSAASLHFALSTRGVRYPNDLLIGPYLHEYDIAHPFLEIQDGAVKPPDGPGLGVSLRPEFLA